MNGRQGDTPMMSRTCVPSSLHAFTFGSTGGGCHHGWFVAMRELGLRAKRTTGDRQWAQAGFERQVRNNGGVWVDSEGPVTAAAALDSDALKATGGKASVAHKTQARREEERERFSINLSTTRSQIFR